MTSYTSNGDGNWATTTIWTPNGLPGSTDTVTIQHAVTIASNQAIHDCTLDGGSLIFNADLQMVGSGALFKITADLNNVISGDGSPQDIRAIKGPTGASTLFNIEIEDVVGEDTRDLDFQYIKFEDNKIYLGNDDNYIEFNTGSNTDPFITRVTPPEQSEQLDIKPILGRNKARVFQSSRGAYIVNISGYSHIDNHINTQLRALAHSNKRIAFIEHSTILTACYIERYRVGPANGVYQPFAITLTECL